jgi:hypothetical protein
VSLACLPATPVASCCPQGGMSNRTFRRAETPAPAAARSSTTRAIPNPTPPNNAAFVLWTDLDPSSGGLIFTWADADRLVVEWNSPHYSTQPSIGAPNANFQIVLHRATNNVTFNYQQHQTVSAPVWAPISVGVENAAGDGGSSGRGGSVQMAFGDPVAPEPGSSVLWPGSCVM